MELIWAYLFIILGLALLAGELFFPTGGILFLLGGVAVAAGVVMSFFHGDFSTGLMTLTGVFLVVPLILYAFSSLWPRTRFGKLLIIEPKPDDDATVAHMPVNLELMSLQGRYGRAASDLRPAGVVEFDGKRVDVVSEALLIPAGAWVRCIDVKAGRVVVRQVDTPDLGRMNFDDVGN